MHVCAHECLIAFDCLFHRILCDHQTSWMSILFYLKIINTYIHWVKTLLDNEIIWGCGKWNWLTLLEVIICQGTHFSNLVYTRSYLEIIVSLILLCLLCRAENCLTKDNLSKVTQLLSNETCIWNQISLAPPILFLFCRDVFSSLCRSNVKIMQLSFTY